MANRTYLCTIYSNNSVDSRDYIVRTRSAMECSKEYGKAESNEIITVRTHNGQILSKVKWDEQSNKYINVSF